MKVVHLVILIYEKTILDHVDNCFNSCLLPLLESFFLTTDSRLHLDLNTRPIFQTSTGHQEEQKVGPTETS